MPHLDTYILDWDYDTFDITNKGNYVLYDLYLDGNYPIHIIISGFPYPGGHIQPIICKQVMEDEQPLPVFHPFARWTKKREERLLSKYRKEEGNAETS